MIIARIPEIKPFNRDLTKNGFLMKLDLAPTNCIVLIENLSEYTAKRMVMLIKITDIISSVAAIKMRISSKFLKIEPISKN